MTNISTLQPVWFKKDNSKVDLMFKLFDKDLQALDGSEKAFCDLSRTFDGVDCPQIFAKKLAYVGLKPYHYKLIIQSMLYKHLLNGQ